MNPSGETVYRKHNIHVNKFYWGKSILPDLVSLHDALFMALQTGSQALLVQTHSFLILKMKAVYTLLANYRTTHLVISHICDLTGQY